MANENRKIMYSFCPGVLIVMMTFSFCACFVPFQSVKTTLEEAAKQALSLNGFVYDDRTGLYYDWTTGFYYDSVRQLSEEINTFMFVC